MKKTMRFLSMAILVLMGAIMTGCSSDDNTVEEPKQPTNKDNVVTLTTTVNLGGTTRAVDAEGHKTFKVGDRIDVIYVNTSDKSERATSNMLTADDISADGKSAKFTVTFYNRKTGTETSIKYFYPAGKVDAVGRLDYSWLDEQDGSLAGLSRYEDFSYNISGLWDGEILPSLTLTNYPTIAEFAIKNSSGTDITNTITGMTIKVDSHTYTITPSSSLNNIWVAMRPFSDKTIQITATAGADVYEKTVTGKTLAAGDLTPITLTMTNVTTDLSMVDCAGNARASRWTANCYMVHTAGYYKLPLVYGNAIKNGEANTAAYTGIENKQTTLTFPNHNGDAITAPWITKSASGEGVNKGMGISVASAELLWQDATGLITAVGISGDYLTLTVGKDATTQEGNALIAAKNSEGTIVWSWHIWVTKQTFAAADLTIVATGDHNYTVTPVNLGWVGKPVSQGYCTYYQWGRKDAFIPGTGTDNNNHTVYNISNSEVTGLTHSKDEVGIDDNIKNPTTFYDNETTWGPCNTMYYNMWDAQQTGTINIKTPTKKTVYDPCPAGFCVPTGNLFYYISDGRERSDGNWDNDNKGKTWSTNITGNSLYFPASVSRFYSDGLLYGYGSYGYYWSASPRNGNSGFFLQFNSARWYSGSYDRVNGLTVRAVAEE